MISCLWHFPAQVVHDCRFIVERRIERAGFHHNRSCRDQIATLTIIIHRSLEWNTGLYQAFDSVDREAMWKILQHYGAPGNLRSQLL